MSAFSPACEIPAGSARLMCNWICCCNWKERKPAAADLKKTYSAETAELALKRLEDFEQGPLGKKIPAIAQCWRRVWEQVVPFFAYPNEIRKIIYTTNAIESLHIQFPKFLTTTPHFPTHRPPP